MPTEVIQQTIPAEHVLGAAILFVHPSNGRRYYGVCEKAGGNNQDFVVYRREADPATAFVEVGRLDGAGLDAPAFITMGGAVILTNGSLELWASGQPKDGSDTSGTGFAAIGKVIPGVDDPWGFPSVTKAVPLPSNVKLNPPAGYRPYGANQGFALSAEVIDDLPVYFLSQEGWGYSPLNNGFGHYVFKQVGNRRAEYVRYNGEDVMDGRGDLYVGGNGALYVTGNESDADKLNSVFVVPGYVPFGRAVYIGGGSTGGGNVDTSALEAQVASLQRQLSAVQNLAQKALERANYVKGIYEPVWGRLDALDARPVGISREEGWQLSRDSVYDDIGHPESGIRGRVMEIARGVAGGAGIDQEARDTATTALAEAMQKTTPEEVERRIEKAVLPVRNMATSAQDTLTTLSQAIQAGIDRWLEASISYTDKRLLNLLWDRAVKLLRYKERTGKTAEQLPINDQRHLDV